MPMQRSLMTGIVHSRKHDNDEGLRERASKFVRANEFKKGTKYDFHHFFGIRK